MSKVRDFCIKIPELCKAEDAERFAKVNELVFDSELAGGTVFDRNEEDRRLPKNRYKIFFGFMAFHHDEGRAKHCLDLIELLDRSHHKYTHVESGHDAAISDLWASVAESETEYPDIAAVLSADEAASAEVAAGWNV
jgi:hypothetical protein